ncbi:MAG: DUF1385 domain-containing protein, partial [Ruminococcaceae bacterium]|nr:DUF1385 domain-containing protein [Oscillospiraceae bacterium]
YIDSMTVGYKCLMRSAEIAGLEDIVEEKPDKKRKKKKEQTAEETASEALGTGTSREAAVDESETAPAEASTPAPADKEKTDGDEKLPAWVMTAIMVVSIVFGMGLALFLFKFLPAKIFTWLAIPFPKLQNTGSDALNSLIKSVFEGVLKIALLVGYMAAISLMKDIRRTFMFHGAEHKTIFCYEAGLELTVENVRRQNRFHPRCGTSFLILMLIVNIFISFFIDPIALQLFETTLNPLARTGVSLLLLPLIVGLGYELIKFAGRHDGILTKIISAPGVWLQHITVLEPTDDMIECAIAAVKEVIPTDDSDRW